MMNDKFVQITGPFERNQDLISLLKKQNPNMKYIAKIGIVSDLEHGISINGEIFQIGKTGILEFDNVQIYDLYFTQDESFLTSIDCVLK